MAGIPFVPVDPGHTIAGKVSWFGGSSDPSDSGHTASGVPESTPGIAVYNRATLGGYWQVTDQRTGKTAVLKQTDLGPAPWTGRSIDVTYSAIPSFGYTQGNFPTDAPFTAKYLGRNPSRAAVHQGPATSATDSALGQVQTQPAAQPQVTQQQANAPILLRALLGGGKSAYDAGLPRVKGLPAGTGGLGPLAAAGLLSPVTTPGQAATPGSVAQAKAGAVVPLASTTVRAASPHGGGFLPAGALYESDRIDAGKDLRTNPGGPIIAPGSGYVIDVKNDPKGFGPSYPVVHFDSGVYAGQDWYIGHTLSQLRPRQRFTTGQVLSLTSKTGINAPPGWAEIGLASSLGQGNQGQGAKIAHYFN